jgi:FixJ family two-component response regulator
MGRVIAIVDDDESARDGLTNLMNSLGYDAMPYASGEEFMRSPDLGRTACLITDLHMPGMTGLQLHQRLIKSGECIPTIFMTAFPDEAGQMDAAQAGVDCFLTKPIHEDGLLECVRRALNRDPS